MAMSLHTVELVVPLEEMRRRLVADPTAGRRDDLAESVARVEQGRGLGLAEYTVENNRPVRDVAPTSFGGWPGHRRQAGDITQICPSGAASFCSTGLAGRVSAVRAICARRVRPDISRRCG